MADFACEVSLVVIDSAVPGDEVRRWWNCKDTPVLDELVAAAPRLRPGKATDDDFDEVPGAACRVFALLFLRGTTPEYVIPRLDDELISEILAAYQGRDGDAPGTQRADLAELAPSWQLTGALECSPMEIYTEAPSAATRDALRKLGDLLT